MGVIVVQSRRLRWLFAVAAFAMASAPAFGADWRRQTITPDGFSIEFSGEVQVVPTPLKPETQEAIVRSTIYAQSSDAYAFLVGATLIKGDFNFSAGVDGTFARYKCTQFDADVAGTLDDGTVTRVIHSRHCADGLQIAASFFLRGHWWYQVLTVIGPNADPADAEHFLNSFRMLPNG